MVSIWPDPQRPCAKGLLVRWWALGNGRDPEASTFMNGLILQQTQRLSGRLGGVEGGAWLEEVGHRGWTLPWPFQVP
jgi:hypothetical protein